MILTPVQEDALAELVNIGFNRAAASLSMLLGQRVLLFAPQTAVYPLSELGAVLNQQISGEVASVNQVFDGAVAGIAMLMMEYDNASSLIDMLTGGPGEPRRMTASDREALMEVGNILLNAYLGTFGSLLNVRITFTVPRLQLDVVEAILDSLNIGEKEVHYAVVVRTEFRLTQGGVNGYVLLVMGLESIEAVFREIEAVGLI